MRRTRRNSVSRPKPHSVCVLSDPYVPAHRVEMLRRTIRETGIDIPLVVVHDPDDAEIDPDTAAEASNSAIGLNEIRLFVDLLKRERAWAFVIAERKLTQQLGGPDLDTQVAVEDIDVFEGADIQYVTPDMDGNWAEFPDSVVDEIADRCDVVLRIGFGLIRGRILTAPEYGVLSFHPADIRRYRGLGPPQAFIDGRDSIGVTLQRLSEDIDGGEIVAYDEVDISDAGTLWEVYRRNREAQQGLFSTGIENLRDPEFEPVTPDTLGDYYPTSSRRSISFSSRILLNNTLGRVQR